MGKVLEMTGAWRSVVIVTALALGLAACGSGNKEVTGTKVALNAVRQFVSQGNSAGQPTAAPPVTRQALSAFSTPMIMAEIPALKATTFLVPYGRNGDVETWATGDDKTISFRQGVMVATRGFGPDIMQASAPSIGLLASGAGNYERAYEYLDGADQLQRYIYRCSLGVVGSETITVVQEQHITNHVREQCTGIHGDFTNEYWFENGVFLRKSKQLLFQNWGYVIFQRVIDKTS
ncbi:YjbF family lipoprotein [Rhodobacter ferrooxidans]|uniref:Lipoprotein n=1 Tax=Rhodobacter ferrooxidans TaxID=371731 RepID=C8S239_9RHOB|nr:YjbF family lipoprotein [Rhodobacter sp. SW2]EEW24911.1 conserved hypothetical protein [Rhodobacter sp. SW2]